MLDVAIVGAGLFGRMIEKACVEAGLEVMVFDSRKEGAGSPAAACLMKPGWLSSIPTPVQDECYEFLAKHYPLHELDMRVYPLMKTAKVRWVPPYAILDETDATHDALVTDVQPGRLWYRDYADGEILLEARWIVVAAGIWTKQLVSGVDVTGRGGWAHWFPGQLGEGFITPWAPYRQTVGFNYDHQSIWVGDGQALVEKSVNSHRAGQSLVRCAEALRRDPDERGRSVLGYRPYSPLEKGLPALVYSPARGLLAVTGGAKNGTVGAAWAAKRALEIIS